MVEDLKRQMRRFEHLIGCQTKIDVTSRSFVKDLIEALCSKYKNDIESSLRLHRLELFYDLVENSRKKHQRKVVDVEDKDIMPEKETDANEEGGIEEKREVEKPDDIATVQAKDIDDWKDLMTLSRIYYVLEHPTSVGLRWKRRISKKKTIPKFGDRDLIEWRVAQHFRLRGLEEWAKSRSEAKKLAEQSPYDFDDMLDDYETRELEAMFQISSGKQPRKCISRKEEEKPKKVKRPFRFTDECMEDWTESYSDDSEEMDDDKSVEEIIDYGDEAERKIDDIQQVLEESSSDEEENISEIFSSYKEFRKYRKPIFEQMDKADTIQEWYDLYYKATTETPKPPTDKSKQDLLLAIEESEAEQTTSTESVEKLEKLVDQKPLTVDTKEALDIKEDHDKPSDEEEKIVMEEDKLVEEKEEKVETEIKKKSDTDMAEVEVESKPIILPQISEQTDETIAGREEKQETVETVPTPELKDEIAEMEEKMEAVERESMIEQKDETSEKIELKQESVETTPKFEENEETISEMQEKPEIIEPVPIPEEKDETTAETEKIEEAVETIPVPEKVESTAKVEETQEIVEAASKSEEAVKITAEAKEAQEAMEPAPTPEEVQVTAETEETHKTIEPAQISEEEIKATAETEETRDTVEPVPTSDEVIKTTAETEEIYETVEQIPTIEEAVKTSKETKETQDIVEPASISEEKEETPETIESVSTIEEAINGAEETEEMQETVQPAPINSETEEKPETAEEKQGRDPKLPAEFQILEETDETTADEKAKSDKEETPPAAESDQKSKQREWIVSEEMLTDSSQYNKNVTAGVTDELASSSSKEAEEKVKMETTAEAEEESGEQTKDDSSPNVSEEDKQ